MRHQTLINLRCSTRHTDQKESDIAGADDANQSSKCFGCSSNKTTELPETRRLYCSGIDITDLR